MSKPLINVYMTVKNGIPWVEHAILSIQKQTMGNWEFIIVDDGSTDATPDLLKKIQSQDSRIRVIPTGGVGRGAALNIALSNCQSDFVANLDADDLAHPHRLEIQYQAALENQEYSVFCSKGVIITDETKPNWPNLLEDRIILKDVTRLLVYGNQVNHSSTFARREAFCEVGNYKENLLIEDYDLWVRLAASGHKIARVESPLVAKRLHHNQSFEAKKHLAYVLRSLKIQRTAINNLHGGPRAWFYLIARLPWGILPRNVRQKYYKKKAPLDFS